MIKVWSALALAGMLLFGSDAMAESGGGRPAKKHHAAGRHHTMRGKAPAPAPAKHRSGKHHAKVIHRHHR